MNVITYSKTNVHLYSTDGHNNTLPVSIPASPLH